MIQKFFLIRVAGTQGILGSLQSLKNKLETRKWAHLPSSLKRSSKRPPHPSRSDPEFCSWFSQLVLSRWKGSTVPSLVAVASSHSHDKGRHCWQGSCRVGCFQLHVTRNHGSNFLKPQGNVFLYNMRQEGWVSSRPSPPCYWVCFSGMLFVLHPFVNGHESSRSPIQRCQHSGDGTWSVSLLGGEDAFLGRIEYSLLNHHGEEDKNVRTSSGYEG